MGYPHVQIGQFNDAYLPVMDGVSLTVQNYAYWLNQKYWPTCVATPAFPGHVDTDPFIVERYLSVPIPPRPPYRLGFPHLDRTFRQRMSRTGFRLVHTHSPFTAGKYALRLAREKHIPIIATLHTKYREDMLNTINLPWIVDKNLQQIVDFFYSVDHVWVPQQSVGLVLREYGYKGPYEVMENGIDMDVLPDISDYRRHGAEYLGLDEGRFLGLYVGQHIMEKNLLFLVESLPPVCARHPEFRMLFVGQGYAKEELRARVETLGIAKQVIFHDVVRDRELLKAIYARSDVFLFPSKYDNAPLVVREAAAFRTPSVLLAGSTAAEVIRHGLNGYLTADECEAFADQICRIVENPAGCLAVGEEASKTLCISWEQVVDKVAVRYKEILSTWG